MFGYNEGSLSGAWKSLLSEQFELPYLKKINTYLSEQKQLGKTVYPQGPDVFNAFNHTPFDAVKVVIIGQDPYHGPNQAHGFCFSVQPGIAVPPSLKNIYKELHADIGMSIPQNGDLTSWADQGVLLLNAVLTVEQASAGSHQGKGWETFTDKVVALLNEERQNIVFLLWGSYAQKKGKLIDRNKHYVLESSHPSPLSSYRGFFGCHHFSSVNTYLRSQGEKPIDWASVS